MKVFRPSNKAGTGTYILAETQDQPYAMSGGDWEPIGPLSQATQPGTLALGCKSPVGMTAERLRGLLTGTIVPEPEPDPEWIWLLMPVEVESWNLTRPGTEFYQGGFPTLAKAKAAADKAEKRDL